MHDSGEEEERGLGAKLSVKLLNSTPAEKCPRLLRFVDFPEIRRIFMSKTFVDFEDFRDF